MSIFMPFSFCATYCTLSVQMAVDVRGHLDVRVAEPLLHVLQAVALRQQHAGAGVPLRYNYDKPEKPRRIKGFEVFSLVFHPFPNRKIILK